jgi:hypothetical protein
MALDYIGVPSYAALLPSKEEYSSLQQREPSSESKMRFSFRAPILGADLGPRSPEHPTGSSTPAGVAATVSAHSLSSLLISSSLGILSLQAGSSPRGPTHVLLTTRDPLSLPIMTSNFRRFMGRIGFLFWLLDRGEEVLMWRRGWKYTSSWILLFSALCKFRPI